MFSLTNGLAPTTSRKTSIFCLPAVGLSRWGPPRSQHRLPCRIYASEAERRTGVPVGAAPADPGCSLPPAAAADFP